jgi:hypothetical protein
VKGGRAVACELEELELPGYFSQVDPEPRLVANEQLLELAKAGFLRLEWLPGENGHLLRRVTLTPDQVPGIFTLVGRTPLSNHRSRLENLLLGERFRFSGVPRDWRSLALVRILAQIREGKSAAPFALTDDAFNQDLITALAALDEVDEETPYRVFSVRIFNDSKRFEVVKNALVRLARLGQPEWRRLPAEEVLREMNLVANPSYLYLSGSWDLIDEQGRVLALECYHPSVGLSAVQAARLKTVSVRASAVLCIENQTTYYETIRRQHTSTASTQPDPVAFLCLSGNPSPACRHLLGCLVESLPEHIPLFAWADLDYGGLNILRQLRRSVSSRFRPYSMDVRTLERYSSLARPLTAIDKQRLKRLSRHPELSDLRPEIEHMLQRGIKLEQEAIEPTNGLAIHVG